MVQRRPYKSQYEFGVEYRILVFATVYTPTHNINLIVSSGVSHSDGSCVLGRIHSDVSSNIPKKVYHIVTDNFVNLLHISFAWLYKTECWGRKFHAFSFNSHRNCKIWQILILYSIQFAYPTLLRRSIFGWNCDHDTPLCDTPILEDTPLCDTPDGMRTYFSYLPWPPFLSSSLHLPLTHLRLYISSYLPTHLPIHLSKHQPTLST